MCGLFAAVYPSGVYSLCTRCVILAVFSVLTACSSQEEPAGVLRVRLAAEPTSLDPAQAHTRANIWVVQQLYTGLVRLDSNLRIQPALAERWEVRDSARTYRFYLRKGLPWPNAPAVGGAKPHLEAADAAATLQRLCRADLASPSAAYLLDRLAGARAYYTGRTDSLTGVRVLGRHMLELRLEQPFPPFLALLAMPFASILPAQVARANPDSLNRAPVGIGPFQLQHWQKGRRIVLKPSPQYPLTPASSLQAVELRFLQSDVSSLAELLNGRLDVMPELAGGLLNQLTDSTGELKPPYARRLRLRQGPQLATVFLNFRLDSQQVWAQQQLRRALLLGVNRPELAATVLQNSQTPALGGLTPPGMPGFGSTEGEQAARLQAPYAPDSARALLAQAGYPEGQGLPPLPLTAPPRHRLLGEYLQQAWGKLGVDVELQLMDGAVLRQAAIQGELACWLGSWLADYPEASNYLELFYGPASAPQGPNRSRYHSPAFDSLFVRALAEPDPNQRQALYRQLDNHLVRHALLIPLYYGKARQLERKRVVSFPLQPFSLNWPLEQAALHR